MVDYHYLPGLARMVVHDDDIPGVLAAGPDDGLGGWEGMYWRVGDYRYMLILVGVSSGFSTENIDRGGFSSGSRVATSSANYSACFG